MSEESDGREMLSEIRSHPSAMAVFARLFGVSLGKWMLLKSLVSPVLCSALLSTVPGFPNLN